MTGTPYSQVPPASTIHLGSAQTPLRPKSLSEEGAGTPVPGDCSTPFPGGHSGVVPPDPIPNSAVKRTRANGSVA